MAIDLSGKLIASDAFCPFCRNGKGQTVYVNMEHAESVTVGCIACGAYANLFGAPVTSRERADLRRYLGVPKLKDWRDKNRTPLTPEQIAVIKGCEPPEIVIRHKKKRKG